MTLFTGHFRASVFPKMSKSGIKWDEGNLAENEEERLTANRTKIDEPKTPFHRLEEDGEEPMAYPPKAPPAKAGGPLRPSEDLFAKIAQAAEERQANAETPEDEEGASPSPGHAHTLVCVRKHSSARCAWRVFAEKRAALSMGGRIITRLAASRSCARRQLRWMRRRKKTDTQHVQSDCSNSKYA